MGQGTWRMGESAASRSAEVRALQLGIDLGMTLIDTAEMYADGGAEQVVGEAVKGRRDQVFVVSKVLPSNASRAGTIAACDRSLRHLGTDAIDLYLLHWRTGAHPLHETLDAFLALQQSGKIKGFGVSNLDTTDMAELLALPGASGTLANQVMYNVAARGIEFDLLPDHQRRGIAIMAYCPLAEAKLGPNTALERVAARHGATATQIMLAWSIRKPGCIAIPKSSKPDRIRQNAAAAAIQLSAEDEHEIDAAFPPPTKAEPLAQT